jgi:hypothetical protein
VQILYFTRATHDLRREDVTNITKQSFARGIGESLQRSGTTSIPTPELLKHACQLASHEITVEPSEMAVPHDQCIKVAQQLVAFNNQLFASGKVASGSPPALIGNDEVSAYGDMLQNLYKHAMAGAPVITGNKPEQQNLMANVVNAEKVLDAHRGEGYAHVGQGNTNLGETEAARIGEELKHPLAPTGVGGAGGNSVVAASNGQSQSSAAQKSASIAESLRKLAMGGASTITGDNPSQQNLEADSANSETVLDAHRPEGYANVGQGNANINETQAANVGEETGHPLAPAHGGDASNSVVEATKQGMWERHFNEVASHVAPRLPQTMPREEKVAAVKRAMAMEPHELNGFIQKLAAHYATPSAPDLLGGLSALQR